MSSPDYEQVTPKLTISEAQPDDHTAPFKVTGVNPSWGVGYHMAISTPLLYEERPEYPAGTTQITKNPEVIDLTIDPVDPEDLIAWPKGYGDGERAEQPSQAAATSEHGRVHTEDEEDGDRDWERHELLSQVAATSAPHSDSDATEDEDEVPTLEPLDVSKYNMSTPTTSDWDPNDMALRSQETSVASPSSNMTLHASYSEYWKDYLNSPGWSTVPSDSSMPAMQVGDTSSDTHAREEFENVWKNNFALSLDDENVDLSTCSSLTASGIQGAGGSSRRPGSEASLED